MQGTEERIASGLLNSSTETSLPDKQRVSMVI
jgi:hypothetical protein